MTKIAVDKALLEQAIEALTKSVWFCNHMGVGDWQPTAMACHRGISALRAALAEPAAETARDLLIQAAAMAIVLERKGNYQSATRVADAVLESARYAAPPAAEPVKWGVDWGSHGERSCVSIIKKHPNGMLEVVATEYGPVGSSIAAKVPLLTPEELIGAHPALYELSYDDIEFARNIEQTVRQNAGLK